MSDMPERIWAWAWEVDRHRGQWTERQEIVGEGTEYVRADAIPAADRIEALTAELATCEKYRDAYDEMGRIGTHAVRDLEDKLAKAEAEAEKYKHAFSAQSRKLQAVLHIEGVKATLAELKGESHE